MKFITILECVLLYLCLDIQLSNAFANRDLPNVHNNHVHEPIGPLPSEENLIAQEQLVDELIEDKLTEMKAAIEQMMEERLVAPFRKEPAKNVIVFVIEGILLSTLKSIDKYKNECLGGFFARSKHGHVTRSFSNLATVISQCYDDIEADQACATTAILTGALNNKGTIAVNHQIPFGIHPQRIQPDQRLASVGSWAQQAGKRTGLVTTSRVTSPGVSSFYGSIPNFKWECDYDIHKDHISSRGMDLATQLIHGETGSKLNVIFGGGRKKFVPNKRYGGERLDRRNLIKEWYNSKSNGKEHAYIEHRESLNKLCEHNEYVLGLFNLDHLDTTNNPSLAEMTGSAIRLLDRPDNENGYLLFVQASKVFSDDEFNENDGDIRQHFDLMESVHRTLIMTNPEDTLILIATDHVDRQVEEQDFSSEEIGDSYEKHFENNTLNVHLLHAPIDQTHRMEEITNAFGHRVTAIYEDDDLPPAKTRCDLRDTGEDGRIFAHGPSSYLFKGTILQSQIAHYIGYISCIGNGLKMCDDL